MVLTRKSSVDAVADVTASPPLSLLSPADLVRRYNSCMASFDTPTVRQECALLMAMALSMLESYPSAPQPQDTDAICTLAAMHDLHIPARVSFASVARGRSVALCWR